MGLKFGILNFDAIILLGIFWVDTPITSLMVMIINLSVILIAYWLTGSMDLIGSIIVGINVSCTNAINSGDILAQLLLFKFVHLSCISRSLDDEQ
jgi:hypothetical protein